MESKYYQALIKTDMFSKEHHHSGMVSGSLSGKRVRLTNLPWSLITKARTSTEARAGQSGRGMRQSNSVHDYVGVQALRHRSWHAIEPSYSGPETNIRCGGAVIAGVVEGINVRRLSPLGRGCAGRTAFTRVFFGDSAHQSQQVRRKCRGHGAFLFALSAACSGGMPWDRFLG